MIFLDSSFVIALADTDDQNHDNAVAVMPKTGVRRVISDLVISESVSAISGRLGVRAGREVFENLLYDSATKTVFGNKRLYERALPICAKYGGRLSFADSITVRVMYDEKVKEIISFDSDFDRVENVARVS